MQITIDVPDVLASHLKTQSAVLYYDTSDYAIQRVVVTAIIKMLDESCLISREEVVNSIVNANGSPVAQMVAPIDVQVDIITDPKKLRIPQQLFKNQISRTWLVWGWCMALPLNTPSNTDKLVMPTFTLDTVIDGIKQTQDIEVHPATAESALKTLIGRQWLIADNKIYQASMVGRAWILNRRNQKMLTDAGFVQAK